MCSAATNTPVAALATEAGSGAADEEVEYMPFESTLEDEPTEAPVATTEAANIAVVEEEEEEEVESAERLVDAADGIGEPSDKGTEFECSGTEFECSGREGEDARAGAGIRAGFVRRVHSYLTGIFVIAGFDDVATTVNVAGNTEHTCSNTATFVTSSMTIINGLS